MEELIRPDVWVVSDDKDARDYQAAGANNVRVQDGAGLPGARNTILHIGRSERAWIASFDDDVMEVWSYDGTDFEQVSFNYLIDTVVGYMTMTGAKLGGAHHAPPNFNRTHITNDVSPWNVCVCACFTVVDPTNEINWDPDIDIRDDVDFSCAHLDRYGINIRVRWLTVVHNPYKLGDPSSGGLNAQFTLNKSTANAAKLLAKWPDYLRKDTRRPGLLLGKHNKNTFPPHAWALYRILNPE